MRGTASKYLIKTCEQLNIHYAVLDEDSALIRLQFGPYYHYVINNTLGLNDVSVVRIMKDKYYAHLVLSPFVDMPPTSSFIDPDPDGPSYRHATYKSISDIANEIEKTYRYPVIIKRNSGSQGENVFLCKSRDKVVFSLSQIYSKKQLHYDHVALAQPYIKPQREFRVIVFNSKVQFAYHKDNSSAVFRGNLSPLHWQDSKATLITETNLLDAFQEFVSRITAQMPAMFMGMDVIEDLTGKLWVVELNGSPAFGEFIKHIDSSMLTDLYTDMLLYLSDLYQRPMSVDDMPSVRFA